MEVPQETVGLETLVEQVVLWHQILDYLPPDDIFFDVRAINTVARLAVSKFYASKDSLHASFFVDAVCDPPAWIG